MTLSELITQYCNDHGLSVRKFAEKTGLSHAYIHFIIKGRNPKTGRPIQPTIESYNHIADAMGITINELFEKMDDTEITIPTVQPKKNSDVDDFLFALSGEIHDFDEEERRDIMRYAQFIKSKRKD